MNYGYSNKFRNVLATARKEALATGSDYVGSEHLLMAMLREGDGVAVEALKNISVDLAALHSRIAKSITANSNEVLQQTARGTEQEVGLRFSPQAKTLLENTLLEAKAMGSRQVGTEHLLLAVLNPKNDPFPKDILNAMGINYDKIHQEVQDIMEADSDSPEASGNFGSPQGKQKTKTPMLDMCSIDLTEMARQGKLDPIIGRQKEVERLVQILSRKKKNNPVLVGEPGVGKTAVIEGLAQKIAAKEVPENLADKRVVSFDMTSLVAGTKYRGQFEERIITLLSELRKNKNIIVFMDELHTIIGAGGGEGGLDASNVVKPALSRGEIQCIGATTYKEFRRYVERDAALERRFQSMSIEPPTVADTIEILRGLAPKYEAHHKVIYDADSLRAAANLSERYLSERHLPDKAIDIMDEAGAQTRIANLTPPSELLEKERELKNISAEKNKAVVEQDYVRAAVLRDKEKSLHEELEKIRHIWTSSKKQEPVVVDSDRVREVISKITGIPVSRIDENESKKLLNLENELKERIVGQDEAVIALSKAIRRTRAGLRNVKRPSSFLFLGPTGVGKTELAKALSVQLFGTEESLLRVDMSEYMEKYSVSRFVGSPPGYVGYEDGGQLVEKIRRKPHCVLLLDEIEKAHPDVLNILLQILDDGRLTDSAGRTVNFRDCIIVMTSNAGTREITHKGGMGFALKAETADDEHISSSVKDASKRVFTPEFLNRIDEQIVFRCLSKETLLSIVDIQLKDFQKGLSEKKITLELDKAAKEFIVNDGYDSSLGARPLRRSIQRLIEDELADRFLRGEASENSVINVGVDDGKLCYVMPQPSCSP
ncbi:MAG: ATP-dependent Clp protease ATP-binding subunit [Fibromonadaceae bacterium]|jgi:ATP-dependent Clp protease ATP-binding subunit ClpC|nr:ATP-dependent Clp protease ATP-binding subunit [Fibromonadaceae bacterium]